MAAPIPARQMRFNHLKIFAGNANPVLAGKICAALGTTPGAPTIKPFSDGEIYLQIEEMSAGQLLDCRCSRDAVSE